MCSKTKVLQKSLGWEIKSLRRKIEKCTTVALVFLVLDLWNSGFSVEQDGSLVDRASQQFWKHSLNHLVFLPDVALLLLLLHHHYHSVDLPNFVKQPKEKY